MQNSSTEMQQSAESITPNPNQWLDKPLFPNISRINLESILIIAILLLAVVSRFADLGSRVMSHDEVNHVVPSWQLFQGNIYRHDPVTHGPLQFHLIALSYFLMGDNDFSSRVPAALFSVGAIVFVLFSFRPYLGRSGAIIAGFLFLISPYLLYYGRYARNEALIEMFAVMTLYAILRYLDKGDQKSLFLLTISLALHYTSKETAYIYTAQALLFCLVLFILQLGRVHWSSVQVKNRFLTLVFSFLVLLGIALGFAIWNTNIAKTDNSALMGAEAQVQKILLTPQLTGEIVALLAALVISIYAVKILTHEIGWQTIRNLRSFDLLLLMGTLVLPLLSAFPVNMAGFDPLDYSSQGALRTGIFVVVITGIAVAIGLWWNRKIWLVHAGIFYGLFTVFYTSFFTNGQGFFTGLVGGLGYWLSQQGVERGSQPWYYYGLIQIPIYEFLTLLGSLLAVYFGIRYYRFTNLSGFSPASHENATQPPMEMENELHEDDQGSLAHEGQESAGIAEEKIPVRIDQVLADKKIPTLSLFLFWTISSLFAYSLAGEKMPWLTVHIAIPLAFTAAWGFGFLVDTTNWKKIANTNGLLTVLIIPVVLASFIGILRAILGNQPPFQGNTLEQLQATNGFILAMIAFIFSLYVLYRVIGGLPGMYVTRLFASIFILIMTVITIRTSYRANYIDYDYATEYLVYAHAGPGPKLVLDQVEEISRRMTKGLDIEVAYDNDALYPYWWYFRNYPNHRWFRDQPTRDLADFPLIISGDSTIGKMEPILRNNFHQFEYIRLWWPNQDYFGLTWERIWNAIRDPQMRTAVFKIWLDRDYSLYAELTGSNNLRVETWSPSSRMRFYIRKDLVSQIWEYGVSPAVTLEAQIDPYEEGMVNLPVDLSFGSAGFGQGEFQSPRGLAMGPDGSIYVADSRNHRIQHFSADGEYLNSWGSFADATGVEAPGGTFNEPWGLAVSEDGSIYVADTWNHRVQKFNQAGEFLLMFGYFGQADTPFAFWGPRDVTVDKQGRVFVTDTGNKRVVVFDGDGNYLTQFGSVGIGLGEMDEPVGISAGPDGNIYIAEAWNQRVQVFSQGWETNSYVPLTSWDISGWFGQSMENKPFISVNDGGNVFITDPEGYKVLQFDQSGKFIRGWGDYSTDISGFNLPSGIATYGDNLVYISDAANNRIIRFRLPDG